MLIFQKQGEGITGEQVHELLNELDTNRNGQVELDEYLQVRPEIRFVVGQFCFLMSLWLSMMMDWYITFRDRTFNNITTELLLFIDDVCYKVWRGVTFKVCKDGGDGLQGQ